MKKLFIFIMFIVYSLGFSNNNNKIQIIENLSFSEAKQTNYTLEIVNFNYDDDFAPCTLQITVKVKIIVDGKVTGQAEVSGSLTFQDCRDIATVGAGFVTSLVEQAISKAIGR